MHMVDVQDTFFVGLNHEDQAPLNIIQVDASLSARGDH